MGFVNIVDEHEYITSENGVRVVNVDALFEGNLKTDPELTIEGKPAQTISTKYGSTVKLVDELGRYFSPGGWDENHYHRKEYMGELVQGPEMFGTLHGTMITAHYDPTEETAYVVRNGDIVIFLNTKFKAVWKRFEDRLIFERIDED